MRSSPASSRSKSKIASIAAILLALAAFGAALTGHGHAYAEETAPGWELTAHILLSMGAAALFLAAAVTALVLVFLDRRLRARRIADLPSVLPPLDSVEKVMFRLIGAGFALLTLALLTGFIFVTNLRAQHLEHKTILSCIAWPFSVFCCRAHTLRLAGTHRRFAGR